MGVAPAFAARGQLACNADRSFLHDTVAYLRTFMWRFTAGRDVKMWFVPYNEQASENWKSPLIPVGLLTSYMTAARQAQKWSNLMADSSMKSGVLVIFWLMPA